MLLQKDGISIELESVLDIQNHKENGYKEVKAVKASKAEAVADVPSLEVAEEKPKSKPKGSKSRRTSGNQWPSFYREPERWS